MALFAVVLRKPNAEVPHVFRMHSLTIFSSATHSGSWPAPR